jgi:lysophospholipase L1-like esterase
VTNFGAEGYVTNQELILLMEQLKADRHPDLVIFYDGVNDSYTGAVSPGIPKAHMSLSNIKARVEGTLGSRLDFLRSSHILQLASAAVNSLRRPGTANPNVGEVESKAAATLDNYETNLRLVRILGEADGFRVFCFWQPAFVYGHKPLAPFEIRIADNEATKNTFRILTAVYEQAGRRAAMDGTFAFLGEMFDSVKEPVYIDKWMHLSPTGNELVARSLAKAVEDGLKPSKLWGQPEGKSKRLPISQRASRSILPSKVSTKSMISGRSCFGELIEFPKQVKKSARNTLKYLTMKQRDRASRKRRKGLNVRRESDFVRSSPRHPRLSYLARSIDVYKTYHRDHRDSRTRTGTRSAIPHAALCCFLHFAQRAF